MHDAFIYRLKLYILIRLWLVYYFGYITYKSNLCQCSYTNGQAAGVFMFNKKKTNI